MRTLNGHPDDPRADDADVSSSGSALEDADLFESRERFRALIETTSDWIWEVDHGGRYTAVSPRVFEFLGYHPEEIVGRTPFDLMPPEEAARVGVLFGSIIAERRPFSSLVNVNLHRDGTRVVLETAGVPFFAADGSLRGYRGLDRDITERWRGTRRLELQVEVSRVLVGSRSLRAAAPLLLSLIGEREGMAAGTWWETPLDGSPPHPRHGWSAAPDSAARVALHELTDAMHGAPDFGLVGGAREACAIRVEEIPGDPASLSYAWPLVSEAIPFAVLHFLGPRHRQPDANLASTLELIGQQIGLFDARTRAEEEADRVIDGSPAVLYSMIRLPETGDLRVTWFSRNVQALTGTPFEVVRADPERWWWDGLHPADATRMEESQRGAPTAHTTREFRFRHADGHWVWIRDELRISSAPGEQPVRMVGTWVDITERVRLEEQLRQSQKMEAIGSLAGGIAHDFNNLLTIIGGNGELLEEEQSEAGRHELLGEIREAADRAAALTRQLLAFSRRQVLEPRLLQLNASVRNLEKILRRLLGEDVAFVIELAADAPSVFVDPGQIEQVLMNLVVNARDAMPRGGRIAVRTGTRRDRDTDGTERVQAILIVEDNGEGMPPEVQERIFEPFFTTKGPGKGTGLGLATVYGIVKQSGGDVSVVSEPGRGTTFTVALPAASPAEETVRADGRAREVRRGSETVLLVEDDAAVRRLARLALARAGYRVVEATNVADALRLLDNTSLAVDLLVTDVVMPGGSGRELAEHLASTRPTVGVLYMSGYSTDVMRRHGPLPEGAAFLAKPFSPHDLAARAREVLDRRAAR